MTDGPFTQEETLRVVQCHHTQRLVEWISREEQTLLREEIATDIVHYQAASTVARIKVLQAIAPLPIREPARMELVVGLCVAALDLIDWEHVAACIESLWWRKRGNKP